MYGGYFAPTCTCSVKFSSVLANSQQFCEGNRKCIVHCLHRRLIQKLSCIFSEEYGGKNIWFEKLKRFRLYTVSIHLLLPCTFLLLLCSAMTDCRQLGLFVYLMTFPIVQMYWKQRQTVNVSLLIFRMIQQSK